MSSAPDERMVRIAELEIHSADLDHYRAYLEEEIAASVEREPGVLMLHAVADRADPTKIRILEVYANREAYETHITTPHFLKYKLGTADMVKSLRLVDVDPIILAAK
ncbi:putative quinol monooxygenase [Devosia epidermidihirudinis]|nr:antibiotic biosynthesis monooxygenase [Devosia epidermidihirudinis]